jgi:hypothetical protein
MYIMIYTLSLLAMSGFQNEMSKKIKVENNQSKFPAPEKKPLDRVSYEERLALITDFFGISHAAAKFLYHRKRQGFPCKKRGDPKFLAWSLSLQNALVKADECVDWEWDDLKFGSEEKALTQSDISLEDQSDTVVFKHEKKETSYDGWTMVKDSKKIKQQQTKALQIMGFIPKPQDYSKKYVKRPRKEKEKAI